MRILLKLLQAKHGGLFPCCPGGLQTSLAGGAIGRLRTPLDSSRKKSLTASPFIRGFASSGGDDTKDEIKMPADSETKPIPAGRGGGRGRSTAGAFSQFLRSEDIQIKREPVGQVRRQQKKEKSPKFTPGKRQAPERPDLEKGSLSTGRKPTHPRQFQQSKQSSAELFGALQGGTDEGRTQQQRRPRRGRRFKEEEEEQEEMDPEMLARQRMERDAIEENERQKEMLNYALKEIRDAAKEVENITLESLGFSDEDAEMMKSEAEEGTEEIPEVNFEELVKQTSAELMKNIKEGSSEDPLESEIITMMQKEFGDRWKEVLQDQLQLFQSYLLKEQSESQNQMAWALGPSEAGLGGTSPHATQVFSYSEPQTKHPATWSRPLLDILESEKMPEIDGENLVIAPEEKEYMKLAWGQIIKNPSLSEKTRREMMQEMAMQLGADREEREKIYREMVLMEFDEEVQEQHFDEAVWEEEEWDLEEDDEGYEDINDDAGEDSDDKYESEGSGYEEDDDDSTYETMDRDDYDDDFKRLRRRRGRK
mmetsp:Transcript_38819/g.51155  ORF Transcript_38819/g.51155 Transcript_38819/m.51155 type:complete len:536 (+) Transcript_38819:168-1775(+)